jgi:fructokinase
MVNNAGVSDSIHTVVGLGEALWDVLPSGKHLGGAPLNFAYIASLLGEHAVICTRVGDDFLGKEIQKELVARNLDASGIQVDPELPTGTVEVSFKDGQPEYEIRQPAAWDAMEWSPQWREIASEIDAICFGTLAQRAPKSRKTLMNFLKNAQKSCLKVFDINLRKPFYGAEVVESTLELATILKLNDLELAEIAGMFAIKSVDQAAIMKELLRRFNLKFVFVTRGEHGAVATNGSETVEHPGFSVKVRDTIGAGDAFTAAAVHCLLAGMDLEKTLAVANKWAAWVASQAGGMPRMDENQREMLMDLAGKGI